MKAKDWKFDKYIPDGEDHEAALKANIAYFDLPPLKGVNDSERESDAFHSGFIRGMAWCLAKNEG